MNSGNGKNNGPLGTEKNAPTAPGEGDKQTLLSLVVPFYNEAEGVATFFASVIPELLQIPDTDFEIVCVNDGSSDDTLHRLLLASHTDKRIRVIDLTRNFGKEAALTAAIEEARGDIVIPFDADLQDPPGIIPKLVAKWREGYDMVIARRMDRGSDSLLKRWSALMFYRIHNTVADLKIPENVGDFRLITREVANTMRSLPESRRFMKGLFAWVGYDSAEVHYNRLPRAAGTSKFSGWKLWNLALEDFTSFSTLPLRIWTYVGAVVALLALFRGIFLILRTLINGVDVPGYASLAAGMLLLGGIQLIGIGILGEYVGRNYLESKRRPVYLVKRRYESNGPDA